MLLAESRKRTNPEKNNGTERMQKIRRIQLKEDEKGKADKTEGKRVKIIFIAHKTFIFNQLNVFPFRVKICRLVGIGWELIDIFRYKFWKYQNILIVPILRPPLLRLMIDFCFFDSARNWIHAIFGMSRSVPSEPSAVTCCGWSSDNFQKLF